MNFNELFCDLWLLHVFLLVVELGDIIFSSLIVGQSESRSEFNLKVRKLVARDPQTGDHICSICKKPSTSLSKSMDHVKSFHLNRADFVCQYCNEAFKTSTLRCSHIRKFHLEEHKVAKVFGRDLP